MQLEVSRERVPAMFRGFCPLDERTEDRIDHEEVRSTKPRRFWLPPVRIGCRYCSRRGLLWA